MLPLETGSGGGELLAQSHPTVSGRAQVQVHGPEPYAEPCQCHCQQYNRPPTATRVHVCVFIALNGPRFSLCDFCACVLHKAFKCPFILLSPIASDMMPGA